ncbi:hypothetical protein B0A55_08076 [Friedmanniomyces simplex]|uniref:Yeast cell wall synthesis Kre9/Knh1-like N-terminal domain-containing protein n=1 Tax=Friedmanniomyces simplex TaxID=329884 RepID=A0A4U0WXZ9_9PEZI|nr:hypothetical protein B0A55_08076 [Friedmanniomyces simplex]
MFSKLLLASGFAAIAAAQSKVLFFTHVPNPITDGQAQALTYATNDTTTPITIVLLQGAATQLKPIYTLSAAVTGGQYIWTPSTSLPDGSDYALQITQNNQINYFGPFQVQGAVGPASSSSSASLSSTATAGGAPHMSSTTTFSTNGTATTTVHIVPATVGTMSAGTGTALPRNTTMSMATLSASTTAVSPATNTADATMTSSGAGFQNSALASASGSTTTTNGASGIQISSFLSLVLGIAGAVFYLQ